MWQPELSQPELAVGTSDSPAAPPAARPPVVVPLGRGRTVEVQPADDAAVLRVRGEGNRQLQIEVRFDASGPVVRVQANTLEVESAGAVSLNCETFSVDARRRIDLRSGGDIVQTAGGNARIDARDVKVEASPGAIRLKANDEVQALGEMILLNCEHPRTETPIPAWAKGPRVLAESPAEPTSGDASVIAELLRR
jgi:hypothetical protein